MQNKDMVNREYQCIMANLDFMASHIRRYDAEHDADYLIKASKSLDAMKEHIEKLQKEIIRQYLEVRK